MQDDLAQAMVTNPRLLVQVENGYYDMATPFFATEFTMQHLGLPADLQKNITLKYYNAGPHDVSAGRRPREAARQRRGVHRQSHEAVESGGLKPSADDS